MSKKSSQRPRLPGERVTIAGSCGVRDDDGEVDGTYEVRGVDAVVCPRNANYTNGEGVPMVGVRVGEHGQGGLIAVPRAALRSRQPRGFLRIGREAWRRIFGGEP